MPRRSILPRAAMVSALAVLVVNGSAGAQSVMSGVQYDSYSFDRTEALGSVSLLSLPFAAGLRLGSWASVSLSGTWAEAVVSREDGQSRIQGPTDTQLQATVSLADGTASITGIVLLPTGHSSHTDEEAAVASLIASDLLLFRVSNWGTGGGGGIRASATRRVGAVGAGLSVGYFVGQDFSPADGEDFRYRPGNNLVVRAALDRAVGRAGKASLQLTYRQYSDDRLNGSNLFRTGDRYQAIGSYSFASGRTSSAVVYAGALHRTEGVFLSDLTSTGGQTFVVVGGGARLRSGSVLFLPSVDLRALRRADGLGQGYDGRIGGSVEWTSGSVTLAPSARFHVGRVSLLPGVDSRFIGTELGMAVRFGGGSS